MSAALLGVGILVAVFVGYNIGGSSTGAAFGPAVGSGILSKAAAGALMTGFALLGGWTVGRNVVETMGGRIVPAGVFSIEVTIAVLFFIGGALFLSNVVGVPASTSMTAVGAIGGLGYATGALDWEVVGRIIAWWIVSPILAFWVSAVVGRYFYPQFVRWFAVTPSAGSLVAVDRSGRLPRPVRGPNTSRREVVGTLLVIAISCYMAFSAGASNVANAVAPLVGNGSISMTEGVLLGGAAIGLGAFTIARRTLDTMGNDLTQLPLAAALAVAVVSASLVTVLSALGIPASFVIIATLSIVGLGWGRATRSVTLAETAQGEMPETAGAGGLAADTGSSPTVGHPETEPTAEAVEPIGEEPDREPPRTSELFDPDTTARVILLQHLVPVLATVAAFLVFRFTPLA